MFIYVDESGTFVKAPTRGSWNVVAALVVPEGTRKPIGELLRRLKVSAGRSSADELKLKDLTEGQVRDFIDNLARLNATLYASCIDSGLEDAQSASAHRQGQVDKILANAPKMIYPEGRASIEDLAGRVGRLSDQLYTQMVVQMDVLDQVYRASTLYYVQRVPATLSTFRWRIDEKNSNRPVFEETMRHMAPPLLQAKSLREPVMFLEGADYSHFERSFRFAPGEMPTYMDEPGAKPKSGSNLGNILRDFAFVRSNEVDGVQVVDLLASTLRRVLRDEFEDTMGMATTLGRLTVQRETPQPSIHLISISEEKLALGHAADAVRRMTRSTRPMLRQE